jgi:hypothetical protein
MVPAMSITNTRTVTTTHLTATLLVNLDLQESGIKRLCLQVGMFCRYVLIGTQLFGSVTGEKNWKQIRTA